MATMEVDLKEFLELLKNAGEEPKFGDPIPLNEAACAEQDRHVAVIEELLPKYKAAMRALRNLKEQIDDEQERWASTMTRVMPELGEVSRRTSFRICDDRRHYEVMVDPEEKPSDVPSDKSFGGMISTTKQ